MKLNEAHAIAGTLSFPSKLPGTSYGLPATACKIGSRLIKIPGSVCASCYALKDFYLRSNCAKAQRRRLAGIEHPLWVEAMVRLLIHTHSKPLIKIDRGIVGLRVGQRVGWNVSGWHRWHDSGDLQSVEHLAKIVLVAKATPTIRHWLPTREGAMVKQYVDAGGIIPKNLVIRLSATMINGPAPTWWGLTSTVHTEMAPAGSRTCPAPTQGNECGECRACWNPEVKSVSYHKH